MFIDAVCHQVSTMQCGLLPITQEALVVHGFAGVGYHDYQGILINSAEKKDIQDNLGPKNKVKLHHESRCR